MVNLYNTNNKNIKSKSNNNNNNPPHHHHHHQSCIFWGVYLYSRQAQMAVQEAISCLWKHPEALQSFTELMSSEPLGFSLDNQGVQTWAIDVLSSHNPLNIFWILI